MPPFTKSVSVLTRFRLKFLGRGKVVRLGKSLRQLAHGRNQFILTFTLDECPCQNFSRAVFGHRVDAEDLAEYHVASRYSDVGPCRAVDGNEIGAGEKGVLMIEPPLPPGCMTTVWGDDRRFVDTYFSTFPDRMAYSTFDWATRDRDGYYFVLGRTDDVINVAGHRLGTREIEEAVQAHPGIAEVAVVGVADALKGQIPVAFAVAKDASAVASAEGAARMSREVMDTVDRELGAIARPAAVHFVSLLPKTRSGKLLRRSIQALAEGRDPGDLTTIEDPAALEQIRTALAGG